MTQTEWEKAMDPQGHPGDLEVYADWCEEEEQAEVNVRLPKLVASFWRWVQNVGLKPHRESTGNYYWYRHAHVSKATKAVQLAALANELYIYLPSDMIGDTPYESSLSAWPNQQEAWRALFQAWVLFNLRDSFFKPKKRKRKA